MENVIFDRTGTPYLTLYDYKSYFIALTPISIVSFEWFIIEYTKNIEIDYKHIKISDYNSEDSYKLFISNLTNEIINKYKNYIQENLTDFIVRLPRENEYKKLYKIVTNPKTNMYKRLKEETTEIFNSLNIKAKRKYYHIPYLIAHPDFPFFGKTLFELVLDNKNVHRIIGIPHKKILNSGFNTPLTISKEPLGENIWNTEIKKYLGIRYVLERRRKNNEWT